MLKIPVFWAMNKALLRIKVDKRIWTSLAKYSVVNSISTSGPTTSGAISGWTEGWQELVNASDNFSYKKIALANFNPISFNFLNLIS